MPPITNPANTAELPVPKWCREILVAIEGLKHWDTSDGDEHLDFFGYLIEDLEATTDSRQGGFPLFEQLNIDNEEDIVEKLERLDEFAQELKELNPEERKEQYSENEVQARIEEAEEIYTHLTSLEREYNTI